MCPTDAGHSTPRGRVSIRGREGPRQPLIVVTDPRLHTQPPRDLNFVLQPKPNRIRAEQRTWLAERLQKRIRLYSHIIRRRGEHKHAMEAAGQSRIQPHAMTARAGAHIVHPAKPRHALHNFPMPLCARLVHTVSAAECDNAGNINHGSAAIRRHIARSLGKLPPQVARCDC